MLHGGFDIVIIFWLYRYNEETFNCYTFVLTFLRNLRYGNLSKAAACRTTFCENFIVPRTTAAGKYISLYRKLSDMGCYIQRHGGVDATSVTLPNRWRQEVKCNGGYDDTACCILKYEQEAFNGYCLNLERWCLEEILVFCWVLHNKWNLFHSRVTIQDFLSVTTELFGVLLSSHFLVPDTYTPFLSFSFWQQPFEGQKENSDCVPEWNSDVCTEVRGIMNTDSPPPGCLAPTPPPLLAFPRCNLYSSFCSV